MKCNPQLLPPAAYSDNPATSLPTKHIHASLNKIKHPINVVKVRYVNISLQELRASVNKTAIVDTGGKEIAYWLQ